MQEPAVTPVNTPPEVIVQTPVVAEVKVTDRPDVDVAVKVVTDDPVAWVLGWAKVIV